MVKLRINMIALLLSVCGGCLVHAQDNATERVAVSAESTRDKLARALQRYENLLRSANSSPAVEADAEPIQEFLDVVDRFIETERRRIEKEKESRPPVEAADLVELNPPSTSLPLTPEVAKPEPVVVADFQSNIDDQSASASASRIVNRPSDVAGVVRDDDYAGDLAQVCRQLARELMHLADNLDRQASARSGGSEDAIDR